MSRVSEANVDRSSRIVLLNRFSVDFGGNVQRVPGSVQRLLAFVSLHEGPVSRQRAAFTLWPTANEAHAYGSLRTALFRLRAGREGQLFEAGSDLKLRSSVGVDVRRARSLAATLGEPVVRRGDEQELEALLLGGELLPDWYDDWVIFERERFRQLRLRALEAFCDRLTRAGRLAEALEVGLLCVAGEPLRESAHRAVMRVYLADGNPGDAIHQYQLCERLFGEQLGIRPSAQMQELLPQS